MARELQQQPPRAGDPTGEPPAKDKHYVPTPGDEASGGGGSDMDTRDRGVPGKWRDDEYVPNQ